MKPISIFLAINNKYSQHCCVTITSILENNLDACFNFHILTDYISPKNLKRIQSSIEHYKNATVEFKIIDDGIFSSIKRNIDYISSQTYYRYIIAELYPQLDKGLYLDCDLVVNGSLQPLWDTNIDDFYCAGAEDMWIKNSYYKSEIGMDNKDLYVNAGVLLLNLKKMRDNNIFELLMQKNKELEDKIKYQDQDIINIVFKNHIKQVPSIYNFTTDNMKYDVENMNNAVIIHYIGNVKPWTTHLRCRIPLKHLYFENLKKTPYKNFIWTYRWGRFSTNISRKIKKWAGYKKPSDQIRVALLIDEFFGGFNTAYGGYGFLARHYIAKYIPCSDIKIDVLLEMSENKKEKKALREQVDDVDVYILPGRKHISKWLQKQNYDLYLSIEMTRDILNYEKDKSKRLILWIQDPRPWRDWLEIETVKLFPESHYWNSAIYDMVNKLYKEDRVKFITQGNFLIDKARDLYRLPVEAPIKYFPNPVDIDPEFDVETYPKKDSIIFIGRIESVKRGWLFCEIAKRMPEYQFYMLGQTFREKSRNESIMNKYHTGIPNLHFTGHVEGKEKFNYIRDAKIMVNTSIHEALPITFLEALAYGTLLVSCQNPENLTEKFGIYTGTVLGDGFDSIDLFVNAIRTLMTDEDKRKKLSVEGHSYVKNIHSTELFIKNMRQLIREESKK